MHRTGDQAQPKPTGNSEKLNNYFCREKAGGRFLKDSRGQLYKMGAAAALKAAATHIEDKVVGELMTKQNIQECILMI